MTFHALGKVGVPNPGTPVRVAARGTVVCARVLFAVDPGNTGQVALGDGTLNLASKSGVARIFAAPLPGPSDGMLVPERSGGGDVHDLGDYLVDAEVAGDGVLVGYWIA